MLHNWCTLLCRGSLEIGDMLSDVAAAPMEMTLLGIQGKVRVHSCEMRAALAVRR